MSAMKKFEEIDYVRSVLMAIVILVHIVNFGTLYPMYKQSMFTFQNSFYLGQCTDASQP